MASNRTIPVWVTVLLWVGVADAAKKCPPGTAKSFLMGFMGHTGSTAAMSMLHKHTYLDVAWPLVEPMMNHNATTGCDWTRTFFEEPRTTIPGFKLRPHKVLDDKERWTKLIDDYEVRFVRMIRENLFKAGIGLYSVRVLEDKAAVQGLMKGEEDHCQVHPESCYFDVESIKLLAGLMHTVHEGNESVEKLAREMNWSCVLDITYEELQGNGEKLMKRIENFLGIPYEGHRPDFQKALGDNPCDVVLNYQDICGYFYNCPLFRPFVEDEEVGCVCENKEGMDDPVLCDHELLKRAIREDPNEDLKQIGDTRPK